MAKIQHLIALSAFLLTTALAQALNVQWVYSTAQELWHANDNIQVTPFQPDEVNDIIITRYQEQEMLGFGGCFGELGWDALSPLDKQTRNQVMEQLFHPTMGANLSFCRTPIGANDFARNYYSLDDYDGDFGMKHFSIARDKQGLIPYIKAALQVNPNLRLWACPWTPPTWMKTNHHYATKAGNGNGYPGPDMKHGDDQFIMQEPYLKAYATYFSKYLTAYKKEGIHISMLMFQNEPYTINIWPNCSWSPQGTAHFVGDYLGPLLQSQHPDVQLWHGTMNTDNLDDVLHVLTHSTAGRYLSGAGFQWEGRDIVGKLHHIYPDMPMMCTENECGDGSNDWKSAERTFDAIKHYVDGGTGAYMYFNMVLKRGGTSSWGWQQNSLVVVDSITKQVTYTPEYYLMKHLSRYVAPGAHKVKTMGNDRTTLVFRNDDGSIVCFIANKDNHDRHMSVAVGCNVLKFTLRAKSFNTFIIQ